MKNILSTNDAPAPAPRVTLKKIWSVCADDSYRVRRQKTEEDMLIAVRTLEGSGIFETADGRIDAEAGSIVFFRASDIRKYRTARTLWRFYWFEFSAETLAVPCGGPVIAPPLAHEETLLEECFQALYSARTAAFASALFCTLLLCYLGGFEDKTQSFSGQIAEKCVQYIRANLSKNLTVREIARHANISERYLHKIFTDELGISPKNYILTAKLKNAAELLRATDLKVNAIALSLGFENQYYFSKIFKKYFACCPAAYRGRFAK